MGRKVVIEFITRTASTKREKHDALGVRLRAKAAVAAIRDYERLTDQRLLRDDYRC